MPQAAEHTHSPEFGIATADELSYDWLVDRETVYRGVAEVPFGAGEGLALAVLR